MVHTSGRYRARLGFASAAPRAAEAQGKAPSRQFTTRLTTLIGAAAGWFGDVMLTQSQKSPADPDELAVTAGLPLGWECTRGTLQTPETPRRPNFTEGNEGNKDGSALRFRCLLFKTSEYNALCTPPNDQLRHSRRSGTWPAVMMFEFA